MASPIQTESSDLADYAAVVRRRWRIVLALILVGAGVAGAYVEFGPRTYTASVMIQVDPLPNNANAVGGRTSGNVNMDNEAQLVQSLAVATRAAKLLHTPAPQDLLTRISVVVPPNTTFLQIQCSARHAPDAAVCAQAFGRAYLRYRHGVLVSGVSNQVAVLTARITALRTQISKLKTQLAQLPARSPKRKPVADKLATFNSDLTGLLQASGTLVPYLASLNTAQGGVVGQIVTPATPPSSPASPRALLLLPSGLLAGLLAGLLLAFAADRRDHRIHSPRDVERFLNLPVLLEVPPTKGGPQVALFSPRTRAGQAFAELSQYVVASLGEGSHVLLVAGTGTGAGCSVVAANLAAALAWTHGEVALICTDREQTVTPELLDINDRRGLAQVLAGTATAEEITQSPASVTRLRVITPGLDTPGVPFQLEYENGRQMMAGLREEVAYVVIETQAADADTTASTLAKFADAAILVIETSRTDRSDAADCLVRLDRLRTTVLGAAVLPGGGRQDIQPPPDQPPADAGAPSGDDLEPGHQLETPRG